MLLVWLKFLFCALVIYFAGSRLARYGDAIAEKTGLCRAWIGIVLLAMITSLPELANGISAVAFTHMPDLAMGDLLGACTINMFSLAMLDLFLWLRGKDSIFKKFHESNLTTTYVGVIALLVTASGLGLSRCAFNVSLFGISIYSFIILGIYLVAIRSLGRQGEAGESEKKYAHLSPAKMYLIFFVCALAVVGAGAWLPFIGSEIVATMGWDKTFVAVLFIAFATTLPEFTVSFTALRLGQSGMAIGNLVGSNVFDLAIIFPVDIFNQPNSIFAEVSLNMVFVALFGALLMTIAHLAIWKRTSNRLFSITMVAVYLFSIFFLFRMGLLT